VNDIKFNQEMVDQANRNFINQANEYRALGDKARKPGFFQKMFTSKEEFNATACDHYRQAANCFKAAADKTQAIECYMLAAECE
jgi:hypothetical protein